METAAIERAIRVFQRTRPARFVGYGAVYACRQISGSSNYSQHSWGNAVDLFPHGNETLHAKYRKIIANEMVRQTTRRTVANRGRKLDVAEVIDHSGRRIWTQSQGWHTYTGSYGDHVHVSGAPLRTGTPACA